MYLRIWSAHMSSKPELLGQPRLPLDSLEGNSLNQDAQHNLAEQWREDLSGDQARGRPFLRQQRIGAGPAHF
jgi:hypothetical protein